jgi:DNA mismatch repair protein MutL
MAKIRVLPDVVASQVAAGEVVERPASVVKELVENSLDAGARRIEVRIDRGGVALIRVSDDGCGMSREDALLSLERHATSKLRHAADLATIQTLGFRGEALPSIASVSRFSLSTRESEALAGTEVVLEGGTLRDVRDWGGAPGTVMEVRDLFFNVPARRKFLRSENTEFGHIEQTVRVQALAHPEVGFTLLRDGRMIFQLPSRAPLYARISGLIGGDLASALVERTAIERDGLRVHGWLASPGRSRSDRSLSLVFINGRAVENPALTHALRAAYGDTLARGQYPLCFLFVEMDPAAVDVNVHPAKREVRFRDGLGIQSTLASLLQECLRPAPPPTPSTAASTAASTAGLVWQPRSERKPREGMHAFPGEPAAPAPAVRISPVPQQPSLHLPPSTPPTNPTLPASSTSLPTPAPLAHRAPANPADPPPAADPAPVAGTDLAAGSSTVSDLSGLEPASAASPAPAPAAVLGPVETSSPPPPRFRLLGLLASTYAVLEGTEGLVLMDLRAAHERILYEALQSQTLAAPTASQPLLVPLILTLPPHETALVRDHLPLLQQMGFGLEEFGTNTLKVEALPAHLPPAADPAAWLAELLHELARGGEGGARARLDFDSLAATVSARATPRTTTRSDAEVTSLLHRLLACDMPYCDPLGRPTLVQFSHQELARKFGRK